jgi:hypothetical protein
MEHNLIQGPHFESLRCLWHMDHNNFAHELFHQGCRPKYYLNGEGTTLMNNLDILYVINDNKDLRPLIILPSIP